MRPSSVNYLKDEKVNPIVDEFSKDTLPRSLNAYSLVIGECTYDDCCADPGMTCNETDSKQIDNSIQHLNFNVVWRKAKKMDEREWFPLATRVVMIHGENPGKLAAMLRKLGRFAAFLRTTASKKQREDRIRTAMTELNEKGKGADSRDL